MASREEPAPRALRAGACFGPTYKAICLRQGLGWAAGPVARSVSSPCFCAANTDLRLDKTAHVSTLTSDALR